MSNRPPGFVVVVEGPDGSGKTTLAQLLASRLHLHYIHEGPEPTLDGPALLQRYTMLIDNAAQYIPTLEGLSGVVFDRLAVSERVYASVLDRPDRLGPHGEAQLSAALSRTWALRILCLPPANACLKAAFERGEAYVTRSQVLKAWSAYSAMSNDPRWTMRYDWTLEGADENLVNNVIRIRKEMTHLWS